MWCGIPNTTPLEVSIAALQRDPIRTARRIKGAPLHDERGGRIAQFACHFGPSQESGRPYMDANPSSVSRCVRFIHRTTAASNRSPALRSVILTVWVILG